MKSRINREAREISISELWWYVVSKWKWLVIGMVVGALLFGVYGSYSAYRANGSEKTNVPNEYTMEDLTPEEQAAINALLEDYDVLVSRIAHGLPFGGDISYADEMTLLKAIEGRRKY
jgi:hypothetical protein